MLDQPMTSKMIAEKDGAIGRLIFNNPARHNAVSLEMWEAVAQIIDDFERDDAVRVIVVSGAGGRAFVSGADISEFKERRASEEAAAAYSKISEGARVRLQETLKPTIAMIRGYCIGGGVGTNSETHGFTMILSKPTGRIAGVLWKLWQIAVACDEIPRVGGDFEKDRVVGIVAQDRDGIGWQ